MNKKQFLLRLFLLFSNFLVTKKFLEELSSILNRSGQEDKFLKMFEKRLKLIVDHLFRVNLIDPNNFEILKGTGELLYSAHIDTGDKNIRVLFSFIDEKPIFLLAFVEIAGKNISDYSMHIPLAIERLLAYKEENNENQQ